VYSGAPTADNKLITAIPAGSPATPIAALTGNDPEAALSSYRITSLPPASQGTLYLCTPTCTPPYGRTIHRRR
jgi:hypothetical protein